METITLISRSKERRDFQKAVYDDFLRLTERDGMKIMEAYQALQLKYNITCQGSISYIIKKMRKQLKKSCAKSVTE